MNAILTGLKLIVTGKSPWSIVALVAVVFALGAGAITFKRIYDGRLIDRGYAKCQLEHAQASLLVSDVTKEIVDEREEQIENDRVEQRIIDTVTLSEYRSLERERENDRRYFEDLLSNARDNTCANEPMPSQLQRRAFEQ